MSNARLLGYACAGALGGAAGAYVFAGWSQGASTSTFVLGHFIKLALAGAVFGMVGGLFDWSGRKVLTGGVTSALALVVIILLILNAGRIPIEGSFVVAFVLAIAGGFGALVSIMYSLMDETFAGLSYASILGAIGGLIGLALGFFFTAGLPFKSWQVVCFGAIYGACVWTAVGVAKKFELIEIEENSEQSAPGPLESDNT